MEKNIIKDRIYKYEDMFLSSYAKKSKDTLGREKTEDECPMRTAFQRDRDRIIYSKAFLRLKNKTQVFFSPEGDHYRTRLTHTLDVSQISRSIARSLSLNEDLTEAIALGHDLGHTPFGHAGERALNKLCGKGFSHNIQSIRVVDFYEKDGLGLNLTYEVKDGILNHKKDGNSKTLEGQAVSLADRIAYINHDIEDAIRATIITQNDLPKKEIEILGDKSSKRINCAIASIYDNSVGKNKVEMTKEVYSALEGLRNFMFERVYITKETKAEEEKANRMLFIMFDYFMKNKDKLPDLFKMYFDKFELDQIVCDYLSSMTDRYAYTVFGDIFMPSTWGFVEQNK